MKKYIIGIIALLSAGAITAQAQQVWINGPLDTTQDWSTTSNNWDAGAVWVDGSDAIFNQPLGGAANLAENINAGTVTFNMNDIVDEFQFNGSDLNVTTSLIATGGTSAANSRLTLNNLITGTGSVIQNGGGQIELKNANTYTGGTVINGTGSIEINDGGALGTGELVINNGYLRIDGGSQTIANDVRINSSSASPFEGRSNNSIFTINGAVNVDVEGVTFNHGNDTSRGTAFGGSFGGLANSVSFDRGHYYFLSGVTTDSAMDFNLAHGGDSLYMDIGDGVNLGNNINVNGGDSSDAGTLGLIDGATAGTFSGNIAINDNSVGSFDLQARTGETVTFSGVLSDDGSGAGIDKIGVGTVILSGDNTQDGRIIVEAGLLVIDGDSSAATGDLTVSIGALLGGSGIIGGAATVNGMLNPGNSPGTLTFNEALDLAADSLTTFEIVDLANFDVLANDGEDTITFADSADIVFDTTGYTAVLDDSFVVLENWASYGGTVANLDITGTDLGGGLSFDTSTLLTDGLVTVIPEPATLGLVATFGAGILFIRRRLMM